MVNKNIIPEGTRDLILDECVRKKELELEIENILNLILSSTNDNPSNPLISELLSPTEISKISSFMTNSIKSLGSLYDTYFSIPSFATVPEEKQKGCLACNIF